jgi:hypothetical protein
MYTRYYYAESDILSKLPRLRLGNLFTTVNKNKEVFSVHGSFFQASGVATVSLFRNFTLSVNYQLVTLVYDYLARIEIQLQ